MVKICREDLIKEFSRKNKAVEIKGKRGNIWLLPSNARVILMSEYYDKPTGINVFVGSWVIVTDKGNEVGYTCQLEHSGFASSVSDSLPEAVLGLIKMLYWNKLSFVFGRKVSTFPNETSKIRLERSYEELFPGDIGLVRCDTSVYLNIDKPITRAVVSVTIGDKTIRGISRASGGYAEALFKAFVQLCNNRMFEKRS